VKFEFTTLDADATIGAYIKQDIRLDLINPFNPIEAIVRSDNGTPGDYSDDVVQSVQLGGNAVTFDYATAPLTDGISDVTLTARYNLASDIEVQNDLDIGLNGNLIFRVFEGEFGGSWVPDYLSKSFGPLLKQTIPFSDRPGGELASIDIYDAPHTITGAGYGNLSNGTSSANWAYQQGAFNEVVRDYGVLVVDNAPATWNPDAPDAVNQIYAFREALVENLNASASIVSDLENYAPTNTTQTLTADLTTSAWDQNFVWNGTANVDLSASFGLFSDNNAVINPNVAGEPAYGLKADLIIADGTPSFDDQTVMEAAFSGPVGAFGGFTDKKTLLDNLTTAGSASGDVFAVVYHNGDDVFRSTVPVSIIGSDTHDLLVHYGTRDRIFDGGGVGDSDVFLANFATSHPNQKVSFTTDAGSDYASTGGIDIIPGVTVRNVEGFFLRTGDQDDDLTSGETDDYLDAGGGNDLITVTRDSNFLERFDGGTGEDVLLARSNNATSIGDGNSSPDYFYGGTGVDHLIYEPVLDPTAPGFNPLNIADTYLFTLSGGGVSIATQDSGYLGLRGFLNKYDGGDYNTANAISRNLRDSSEGLYSDAFYIRGPAGEVVAYEDIEHISFHGTDFGQDIALFNGGLTYDGGEGVVFDPNGVDAYANTDILLGDFAAFAGELGVATGISLRAEDRLNEDGTPDAGSEVEYTQFGHSEITGYERLAVRGTNEGDFLLGGKYADFLSGGAGNDVIDGGEFESFVNANLTANSDPTARVYSTETITQDQDSIVGGRGNDTIYWSDDGADRINGDQPSVNGSLAYTDPNDLLIVRAEADSLGLEYGLFDANFAYPSTAYRFEFDATSSNADLVNALVLIDQPYMTNSLIAYGTGMRFGDTLGPQSDPWMAHTGMDHVNIATNDATDDLHIYQGGFSYIAGEAANGLDVDVFAADFSDDVLGIEYIVTEDDTEGTLLANGVFVQGFERVVLKGGEGADTFIGGAQNDDLDGGAGGDLLYGGASYELGASASADHLKGGDGDDNAVWFTDGNDTIEGGAGDDTLTLVSLGEGWRWDGYDATSTELFFDIDASDGFTTLNSAFLDMAAALSELRAFIVSDNGGGNHLLSFSGFETVNLAGTDDFDDVGILIGDGIVWGGETLGDRDILLANLEGETADITLFAEDDQGSMGDADFDEDGNYIGDSAILQQIGNGAQVGGFERLHFGAGSGNDTLKGGAFVDALYGHDGDDQLDGGGGGTASDRDMVFGQNGNDRLVYTGGFARIDGGFEVDDFDTLEFAVDPSVLGDGLVLSVLDDAGASLGTFNATTAANRTDLTQLMSLVPSRAGDVNFAAQADALELSFTGGSLIYRNIENTVFRGGIADDVLVAPFRNGVLFGDEGNDLIVSGVGLDMLIGGAGLDTYVFDTGNGGFGVDTIALESFQGAVLYFNNLDQADVTFSVISGDDLRITPNAGGGAVTVTDYFAQGGNGFDFTFDFQDFTGKLDLSNLPGITPGGTGTPGLVVSGTPGNDDLTDSVSVNADTYFAGAGDDIMAGSAGGDFFDGASGQDFVTYERTTATVGRGRCAGGH